MPGTMRPVRWRATVDLDTPNAADSEETEVPRACKARIARAASRLIFVILFVKEIGFKRTELSITELNNHD